MVLNAIGSSTGLLRSSSAEARLKGQAGAIQLYPSLSKYVFHSSQQQLLMKDPVMKTIGEVLVITACFGEWNPKPCHDDKPMLRGDFVILSTILPTKYRGAIQFATK